MLTAEPVQPQTASLTEQDIIFNNCISHLTAKLSQIKANEQLKQQNNNNSETVSPESNSIKIVAFQPSQKRTITETTSQTEKEVPNPKPRTVITLPHLLGRQRHVRTTTASSSEGTCSGKTPIIIRERVVVEPVDSQQEMVVKSAESPSVVSFTSTVSVNSGQGNKRVSSSP